MAEENKDKTKSLNWNMFCKNTKTLLDAMIDCERKHLFFNGLSHSEKEYAINKAIENKSRLNSLQTSIRGLLKYQDSKLIEKVESYVAFKSRLCYFINMMGIEKILLKDVKALTIEEKLNLEGQLNSQFQIIAAKAEISDQKSKKKTKEDNEQYINIESSENNKIEIYPPHLYNIKGNTDADEYNDSERFYDESQSMKQNSSYEIDKNDTKHMKQILHMDELENTVAGETFQIKMEKISHITKKTQSPDTLLCKSLKLKLDKHMEKHRNGNMARENYEVQKERIKRANKTSKPSYKEEEIIEFEKSQQNMQSLLKRLNLDIESYELELKSLEEALQCSIQVADTVSIENFELDAIISEVSVENFMNKSENAINYTMKWISVLQSRKGTNNIMKDAINLIFYNQEKANVSNNNILRVKNYSSMAESKPRDTSSRKDDSFYVHLEDEGKNYGPDSLILKLNKNGIFFAIDTDGRKVFEVDDKDSFSERKSTIVVLNYEDEKVKISFIDNQIVISTENSEFDIFIRRPQPDDLQDGGTQTVTGH